jgi:hypothetical protein
MTMTRSDRDQRLDVTDVSRRGAHRARPNPVVGLMPVVALAVLLVAVLGMAYFLFGRTSSPQTSAGDLGPATGASASASASAGQSPGTSVAASPAPATVAPPVDKTITLNLYNATSPNVPGQSRRAAAQLTAGGWTIGTVETWTGAVVERTTVYYADPSQLSTARAVAKALGGGSAKINKKYTTTGLAVLVGNNYTP